MVAGCCLSDEHSKRKLGLRTGGQEKRNHFKIFRAIHEKLTQSETESSQLHACKVSWWTFLH